MTLRPPGWGCDKSRGESHSSKVSLSKAVVDENGPPVRPGDVLRYVIVAQNSGSGQASDVELSDPLPATLDVVDLGGGVNTGGTVVWDLGRLAPGQSLERVLRVRVREALDNGTRVSNQAELIAQHLDIQLLSDNPETPEVGDPTDVQVVSAADFSSATKTVRDLDGGPLRPGDRVEYTIRVNNTGDASARNTQIVDTLTDDLILWRVSGSC